MAARRRAVFFGLVLVRVAVRHGNALFPFSFFVAEEERSLALRRTTLLECGRGCFCLGCGGLLFVANEAVLAAQVRVKVTTSYTKRLSLCVSCREGQPLRSINSSFFGRAEGARLKTWTAIDWMPSPAREKSPRSPRQNRLWAVTISSRACGTQTRRGGSKPWLHRESELKEQRHNASGPQAVCYCVDNESQATWIPSSSLTYRRFRKLSPKSWERRQRSHSG